MAPCPLCGYFIQAKAKVRLWPAYFPFFKNPEYVLSFKNTDVFFRQRFNNLNQLAEIRNQIFRAGFGPLINLLQVFGIAGTDG